MKYAFFGLCGFLLGFLFVGNTVPRMIALSNGPAKAALRGTPPGATGDPADAVGGGLPVAAAKASLPETAKTPAVPPKPARERPGAFAWNLLNSIVIWGETSALDQNPELSPTYRRVLAAEARYRLAGMKWALGLNDAQFDSLVAAAVEQRLAFMAETETQKAESGRYDSSPAVREERSRQMEAKLATFLTPEQIEIMASLGPFGFGNAFTSTLDDLAARGIVVSPDVLRASVVESGTMRNGTNVYVSRSLLLDSKSPGLSDEQRAKLQEREAAMGQLRQAGRLASRLRSTSVRDPEVFDIWPW